MWNVLSLLQLTSSEKDCGVTDMYFRNIANFNHFIELTGKKIVLKFDTKLLSNSDSLLLSLLCSIKPSNKDPIIII